jgi:hypothetical protein
MVGSNGDVATLAWPVISDVEKGRPGMVVESYLVESAVVRVLSRRMPHLMCRDAVKMIE